MTCIYCRADSSSARGLAHVFPEGVVKNHHTLPLGALCDSCNNYVGTTLDPVLLEHPIIALSVQVLGLPGKKGKARSAVGGVKRDRRGRYVTIPCDEPIQHVRLGGGRVMDAIIRPSPQFDDSRFGRALHQIAFCTMAHVTGVDRVLEPQFDPVRRYIRSPKKGETWPYAAYCERLSPIRDVVTVESVPEAPGETVRLLVFQLDFYVDLLNTGGLGEWVKDNLPPTAYYAAKMPRTKKPGRRRFQVKVYLDDTQPGALD